MLSMVHTYFVTICTDQRQHLFGHITNETVIPNTHGEIVLDCWDAIPDHFPNVECDMFVLMPNHVHGILVITGNSDGKSVGTRHALSLLLQKPSRVGTLSIVVGSFKSAVTKRINELRGTPGAIIWQGRFHDHIIRDEEDLNRHRQYILTNPARWDIDRDNIPLDENW